MQTIKQNKRHPVLMAMLVQLIALSIVFVLASFLPPLTIVTWAVIQGLLASLLSFILKMPIWWLLIQAVFLPAIVLTLSIGLSPLWFGLGFCLLILIYGKTYQTQVPLYLTSHAVTHVLKSYLPQKQNFKFIDLGCGFGGLLGKLSKTNTNGHFHGVETAPLTFCIGKLKHMLAKSNCHIRWEDLWKQNLSHYDIVYAYLSPAPMELLWQKVCEEMQPGSIFISNTFAVPGVTPDHRIELEDFSGSTLYIWRIKSN